MSDDPSASTPMPPQPGAPRDATDPATPTAIPPTASAPFAPTSPPGPFTPSGEPSRAAASLSAIPGLADLDATSRMIVGASLVALVVAVIGGILRTWDSTAFLLLILAGSAATAATAWYTSTSAAGPRPSTLPLSSIEIIGAVVVALLGIGRSLELIFDLDTLDGLGGIVDLLAALVLAGAGIAMVIGVTRRDPTIRSDAMTTETGVRLALGGLLLVLIGWALNLTIGSWRMNAGTLSIALSAIAVVVIVLAPRWEKTLPGIPVAWLGAAFGVVVAFLALGLWGELGRDAANNGYDLGLADYLPFLAYVVGVAGIIAGGVLAGQVVWAKRPKPEAVPASGRNTAPAPVTPAATSPEPDVSSERFASSTPAYATSDPGTVEPADRADAAFWEPAAASDDDTAPPTGDRPA